MGVPDNFLICPYNKSHEILRERMPQHLHKCVKYYKGPTLSRCPFNAMHMFEAKYMADHLQTCKDYQVNHIPTSD